MSINEDHHREHREKTQRGTKKDSVKLGVFSLRSLWFFFSFESRKNLFIITDNENPTQNKSLCMGFCVMQ